MGQAAGRASFTEGTASTYRSTDTARSPERQKENQCGCCDVEVGDEEDELWSPNQEGLHSGCSGGHQQRALSGNESTN